MQMWLSLIYWNCSMPCMDMSFPGGSVGKESACNAGNLGSIPGLGRSPGEGKATHSSILAWRIPWTEEPGMAPPWGSKKLDMTEWLALSNGSVQFSSVAQSCPTLRPHESQHARPPCPSQTPGAYSNSCPSSWWCHPDLILCHPLFLLPPIPPSIRVFSKESTLRMRWPKYRSFNLSISPSNVHLGLISFRIEWK